MRRAGSGRCGRSCSATVRRAGPNTCCKNWSGQRLVIALPYLWLLLFFLIPFLIVLKISFAEFSPLGRPPYEPVFRWLEEGALQIKLLFGSYTYLLNEPLYVSA